MRIGVVLVLGMAACQASAPADGGSDTDLLDEAEASYAGAELAPLSDGPCPDMTSSGAKSITSSDQTRNFELRLPAQVEPGLPALVVWHGLGDSAASMASWMALEKFAEERGYVVVLPDSADRDRSTWNLEGSNSEDLVLYDDLRTCLSQELAIDLAKLHVTGFSFGGLMSTVVTMHRSETLASAFVMSGGTSTFFVPYASPSYKLPVMVMWGGEGDTYGEGFTQVRFEETALDFSENLRADGHVVAHCDHGGGHRVPWGIHDILDTWLGAHVYGEPSPLSEDLGDMPEWCVIP